MDEFQIQVAGRLSALEFVLEVMLANQLASIPDEHSKAFKQAMQARQGYIKSGPIDVELMQSIAQETSSALKNFLKKVESREADIRDQIG